LGLLRGNVIIFFPKSKRKKRAFAPRGSEKFTPASKNGLTNLFQPFIFQKKTELQAFSRSVPSSYTLRREAIVAMGKGKSKPRREAKKPKSSKKKKKKAQ